MLKIFASYDYKGRMWIFLELMDFDLYSFIEKNHSSYTEGVAKFILCKVLEGL